MAAILWRPAAVAPAAVLQRSSAVAPAPGAAAALEFRGPPQQCRGAQGQYVYWIVMPYPTPETVAEQAVWTPDDFDYDSFWELVIKAHADVNVVIDEAACFK